MSGVDRAEAEACERRLACGLLQEPKRLPELHGFEPAFFSRPECRAVFVAARGYYKKSVSMGKARFAGPDAVERLVGKSLAGPKFRDGPARKRAAAIRQGVASLVDHARDGEVVDEHSFGNAMDVVRDRAMDERARHGLLSLVDEFKAKGSSGGLWKDLVNLAATVGPSARAGNSDVGTLHQEAALVKVEYLKAKASPGAGRVLTPFPQLNRSTGGGKVGRLWMVAAFSGQGKAQPVDAKVLVPGGWKRIGDIRVGDRVINPAGGTARVTGVFPQGMKPAFRVTFTDGSSTQCCDEHLWSVTTSARTFQGLRPRVMSIREMDAHANRYFVPLVSPCAMRPARRKRHGRRIDPYLMGVLLGDGCFVTPDTRFSTADAELVDLVRASLPPKMGVKFLSQYDYGFTGAVRGWKNWVDESIDLYGLRGKRSFEKHIPEQYLWAPVDVRLAVIQGLLDTDGSAGKDGSIEFSTTSERLAADVRFLVQSLGWVCRTSWRVPRYTYKGELREGRRSCRVKVSAPAGAVPFRLSRKMSRWSRSMRRKCHPRRGFRSIEPVGSKQQVCIALDSKNQLYVTDDFIVTHNTQCAKDLCYHAAIEHGKGCFIVTSEQTKADVRLMMATRHSHRFIPGGIPFSGLEEGTLRPEQERALDKAVGDLEKGSYGPISYWTAPGGTTTMDIQARLEFVRRRHPVEVVMVDHTMLFHPARRQESEVANLSAVIREIKQMALDQNVWAIACHQIKREGYEAASKRRFYVMSDMAGTAEAERSADVALWLWRDDAMQEIGEMLIGTSKNRWGRTEPRGFAVFERLEASAFLPLAGGGP